MIPVYPWRWVRTCFSYHCLCCSKTLFTVNKCWATWWSMQELYDFLKLINDWTEKMSNIYSRAPIYIYTSHSFLKICIFNTRVGWIMVNGKEGKKTWFCIAALWFPDLWETAHPKNINVIEGTRDSTHPSSSKHFTLPTSPRTSVLHFLPVWQSRRGEVGRVKYL